MAFDGSRLGAQVDSIGGGLIRIFGYHADVDTPDDLIVPGYIPYPGRYGLRDNDVLLVEFVGEDFPALYYVSELTESAATLSVVEDGPYVTYTGGGAYTTKERFRREIPLEDTSVAALIDDVDQDAGPALKALFQEAALDNKQVTARQLAGDLWVGSIDASTVDADQVEGHLRILFNSGLTIRGIPEFEGPVLSFKPLTDWAYDFHAEDLRISAEGRPFSGAVQSSTALDLQRWRQVVTYDYWSFGGDQIEDSGGAFSGQTIGGDSGITQLGCVSSCHVNPYFYGFNDLGFYGSGNPPSEAGSAIPPDTGLVGDPDYLLRRGHILINPHSSHCSNAFAFKRLQQHCTIIGGLVEMGSVGVLADGITDQDAGWFHAPQINVNGLQGKKLLSRLISVGPEVRVNASNCTLEDWGRNPFTGNVSGSVWSAYYLAGGSHGQYSNCRAVFKEWDGDFTVGGTEPEESRGWFMADYQNPVPGGLLYVSEFNIFSNCMVEGANRAYYEDDATGAGHNHGEIYAVDCVSAPYVRLQTDSTSHIQDGQHVEFPITVITSEADYTTTSVSCSPVLYVDTTLTSNMDLRLNGNSRTEFGKVIRIVHTGSGAFNVLVYNETPTLIATLALDEWVDIQHTTGVEWLIAARGTL